MRYRYWVSLILIVFSSCCAWFYFSAKEVELSPSSQKFYEKSEGLFLSALWGFSASVAIDGKELPLTYDWDKGGFEAFPELEDGEHSYRWEVRNWWGGEVAKGEGRWLVDHLPPGFLSLSPSNEAWVNAEKVLVKGQLDQVGTTLFWGEEKVAVDAKGGFEFELSFLQEKEELSGRWSLKDEAGNEKEVEYHLYLDRSPPEIAWEEQKELEVVKNSQPLWRLKAEDNRSEVKLKADFGGAVCEVFAPRKVEGWWEIRAPKSFKDGRYPFVVQASDRAGNTLRKNLSVVVNTNDVYGVGEMMPGAIGENVAQMQRRLAQSGFLRGSYKKGVYDGPTEMALASLKAKYEMPAGSLVDEAVYKQLGPKIYINKATFQLFLERPGKPGRRYDIAYGKRTNPTLPGTYEVVELVRHPPWIPPKSDWAKDAKPVPPGPDNPLGSRWIGLDHGGYGIHGTNNPGSIGRAASRGCIRMRTPEVEDLFEYVELGTPVYIFRGNEKNPILKKYWK